MDDTQVFAALAKNLARRNLSEGQLSSLSEALKNAKHSVIGADICTHGICLDFGVDGGFESINLTDFTDISIGDIHNIEIFPEGIILPDRMRVRVTQKF